MMAVSDLRDGVTCGILDTPSGKMNPEWLWATSVAPPWTALMAWRYGRLR
jgi:hypothetical protein